MIKSFLLVFWQILKYPIIVILCVLGFFLLMYLLFIGYGLVFQHRKIKKGTHKPIKKRPALLRLVWDFPKQLANDFFDLDPDDFPYKGLSLIHI